MAATIREFILTDTQYKKYQDWANDHREKCPLYKPELGIRYCGLGGTPDTFCFNPTTAFGDIVIIKCACGAQIDVSELE